MAGYLKTQACKCAFSMKLVSSVLRTSYMPTMKYVHAPLLSFLLQFLHSPPNDPPNFISPLFFTIDKPLIPLVLPKPANINPAKILAQTRRPDLQEGRSQLIAVERGKNHSLPSFLSILNLNLGSTLGVFYVKCHDAC